MNPTSYDEVLTGLKTMNEELITRGIKFLVHHNDTKVFQYKFRLDFGRAIRMPTDRPIKTFGEYSLLEIATIASSTPEILDYTADHIPFGVMLLDLIKKAQLELESSTENLSKNT